MQKTCFAWAFALAALFLWGSARADELTASNDDAGVARVLERLFASG